MSTKNNRADTIFLISLVLFFGTIIGVAIALAGNANNEEWIEQDDCFIRIYDDNSWFHEDTQTVTTYCPE